jgi:hypothetical protein
MTCLRDNEHGAEVLIGYLEGTLAEGARRELEAHAAECAECRGLLAVQAELDEFVPPAVSAGFDGGVYARIERERAGQWWRRPWKVALPAAVAAGLMFTVWTRQAPVATDGAKQALVDFDVQQLEQELEVLELLSPMNAAADRM